MTNGTGATAGDEAGNLLERALRLRDAGRLERAIELGEAYLQDNPGDARAEAFLEDTRELRDDPDPREAVRVGGRRPRPSASDRPAGVVLLCGLYALASVAALLAAGLFSSDPSTRPLAGLALVLGLAGLWLARALWRLWSVGWYVAGLATVANLVLAASRLPAADPRLASGLAVNAAILVYLWRVRDRFGVGAG